MTGKKNSDKEYQHIVKAWDRFEMKAMKDYHDLHLKCDVLLLGDKFEKFKTSSLRNYQLCHSHYLRAPALSWNVMLNMTKVELELISDADLCSFFKKGMVGRVSHISERFK